MVAGFATAEQEEAFVEDHVRVVEVPLVKGPRGFAEILAVGAGVIF